MENNKPDKHVVSASAVIPARRERVYSLISNYKDGHPRILPKQFSSLVVEQGGVGAGTVIRFQMSLLGRKQTFRAAITEPEPGRVLVETDLDGNGAVTTFTVNPGGAPADSYVTISTQVPVRGGFLGKIEKTMTTLLLRPSTSGNWKISRVWLPGLSASELHLLSTLSETQGPSTALGMTMSGYTFAAFVVGTFAAINYRNP